MFSSNSTTHLAFVSRQVSALAEHQSIDAALKAFAAQSPPDYKPDLEYLRGLLDGSNTPKPSLGPNPYDAIATLAATASNARETLFKEFVSFVERSKVVFDTYWAGVVGLAWYLGAVSMVALFVGLFYSTAVIPTYGDMAALFGADLPPFSAAVFRFGSGGAPLFAIALIVAIVTVVGVVMLFNRRVQRLQPLPHWPNWTPILGRVARTYNEGLLLNYARILRRCGSDAANALYQAALATKRTDGLSLDRLKTDPNAFSPSQSLVELGIAARLSNFDAELDYQCVQHDGRLAVVLVEARDRLSLVLKIALYLYVAALVIGMYLPIFQLGSII
ncbi:MAG: hypothetical protein AAGH76_08290 [Pseudomonadota bacterium]